MQKGVFYNTNVVFYWFLPFFVGILVFILSLLQGFLEMAIPSKEPFVQSILKVVNSGSGLSTLVIMCFILTVFLLLSRGTSRIDVDFDRRILILQAAFNKKYIVEFHLKNFQGYKVYPVGWLKVVKLVKLDGNEVFLIRLYNKNKVLKLKYIFQNQLHFSEIPFETKVSIPQKIETGKSEYELDYEFSTVGFYETINQDKKSFLRFVLILLGIIVFGIIISIIVALYFKEFLVVEAF
jgi:hypothetical protein